MCWRKERYSCILKEDPVFITWMGGQAFAPKDMQSVPRHSGMGELAHQGKMRPTAQVAGT